jgi:hypothetical protein
MKCHCTMKGKKDMPCTMKSKGTKPMSKSYTSKKK